MCEKARAEATSQRNESHFTVAIDSASSPAPVRLSLFVNFLWVFDGNEWQFVIICVILCVISTHFSLLQRPPAPVIGTPPPPVDCAELNEKHEQAHSRLTDQIATHFSLTDDVTTSTSTSSANGRYGNVDHFAGGIAEDSPAAPRHKGATNAQANQSQFKLGDLESPAPASPLRPGLGRSHEQTFSLTDDPPTPIRTQIRIHNEQAASRPLYAEGKWEDGKKGKLEFGVELGVD